MSSLDTDRIESILTGLSERVAKIEERLKLVPTGPQAIANTPPPPEKTSTALRPSDQKERGSWLAWAGIAFFVLAASYFVKLTIDSGWLTAQRQFVGIVLFGIGLILAGFKLRSRETAFATLLPGAGIVTLYIASYSGYLIYGLYDLNEAIYVTGAVSVLAIVLFRYFQHDFFLGAAAVGSYVFPLIVGSNTSPDIVLATTQYLFWDVVFTACAITLNRRLLVAIIGYLSIGLWQIMWMDSSQTMQNLEFAVRFQLLQFALMAVGVLIFSIRNKNPLLLIEAWFLLPVLILFYAIEYGMLARLVPDFVNWIALGFAVVLTALYQFTRISLKQNALASGPALAAMISLILFHTVYLELLPANFCPWLAAAIVLLNLAISSRRVSYDSYWIAGLFPKFIFIAEYLRVLENQQFLYQGIALSLTLFILYLGRTSPKQSRFWILVLAVVQAINALNQIVVQLADGPPDQFIVSGSWAGLAMLLIVLGYLLKDYGMAKAAVTLFGLVACKVVVNDLDSANSMTRILSLVVIGALLYGGGIMWKNIGRIFQTERTMN